MKWLFYFCAIIVGGLSVFYTINFLEKEQALRKEISSKIPVTVEKKVYVVPEKTNEKVSVYRIDKETIMIILDEKTLKSKTRQK